jgi:hypothetical protein
VIWGKREIDVAPEPTALEPATVVYREAKAEPQDNTIGLVFPWQSISWPKPSPPTYISWGKRQDQPPPTEEPAPPTEEPAPPTETPPAPAPAITLEPPTNTVIWGKRDAVPEPTTLKAVYV